MAIVLGTTIDLALSAAEPMGLTWFGTYLWFSDAKNDHIVALDPKSGARGAVLRCADVAGDLTSQDGLLYQVAGRGRDIRLLHPRTGNELGTMRNPRPGSRLTGLEATIGGIWLGYADLRCVDLYRTPAMELVRSFEMPNRVTGLAMTQRSLLVSSTSTSTIRVLDLCRDPAEMGKTRLELVVPGRPAGLTWDGTRVWYCDEHTIQVRAVDVPGMAVI